jgi:predicted ATPase
VRRGRPCRHGQEDWQARLDRELPNIRAALDRCLNHPARAETGLRMVVGLLTYWLRGRLDEGRLWLDRALDQQVLDHYRDADDRTNMLLDLVPESFACGLLGDWH